ncbi:MAG: phosphohistidine phosphatase SixA [Verrucomicrobiota bacterium]|nr:phosphohistidine phosphatase SixA [Verrucomicrobiota bacterium]
MQLYLVRHAHAVTEQENPQRPLSSRGRDECARLVGFLKRNRAFSPTLIWHSPLIRALETARLLAEGLNLEAALVETSGLLPEDDPEKILSRLENAAPKQTIAIVGHEPFLGALATLLVRGKPQPVAFDIKKGAVLALESTGGVHKKTGKPRWHVCWQIDPTLLD